MRLKSASWTIEVPTDVSMTTQTSYSSTAVWTQTPESTISQNLSNFDISTHSETLPDETFTAADVLQSPGDLITCTSSILSWDDAIADVSLTGFCDVFLAGTSDIPVSESTISIQLVPSEQPVTSIEKESILVPDPSLISDQAECQTEQTGDLTTRVTK